MQVIFYVLLNAYMSNNNITNYKIDLVGVDLGLDLTKLQK